jgi:toxin CptA
MHDAPSVSYPAGRSRFAASLLLGIWLPGCAAALLWHARGQGGWRPGAMLAVLAAAGLFAAWHWWRAPAGTLTWDGEDWRWSVHSGAAAPGVEVALDLQRVLLLHWKAGGGSHWIWLERAARAERWDDLRRAVYSRARPKALQQAQRPAAKP